MEVKVATLDTVEERLARLELTLPDAPAAVAAFQPYVRCGTHVYVSGRITTRDGQLVATGRAAGVGRK